jgi:hypothetical protein
MKKPAPSRLRLGFETLRQLDHRELMTVVGGHQSQSGQTTIPSYPPTHCPSCYSMNA